MLQYNGSIVLYHNKEEKITRVIRSFLNKTKNVKLYLIDNSLSDDLESLKDIDERIEYIFNHQNLGYGAAHNIAIRKSIKDNVIYHVVLNPDVYFENDVLEKLGVYMDSNLDVGNVIPQVFYPNGEIQYLCKLLPTPVDLIFRRFIPLKKWKEKRNIKFELRNISCDKCSNVPSLSGCFMFLRVNALKDIGLFDEKMFMYLEDLDLNRRLHQKYRTVFYPHVSIYHEYAKESYQNKKLLWYHIKSAIYYFNKWGWFFDKNRKNINANCLKKMG